MQLESICARWLLWGKRPRRLFQRTHGGRDFAVVVGALAGCGVDAPPTAGNGGRGPGPKGLAGGPCLMRNGSRVAQRRRRVFVVLDAETGPTDRRYF